MLIFKLFEISDGIILFVLSLHIGQSSIIASER